MSTPTTPAPTTTAEALVARMGTAVTPVYDGAVPLDTSGNPTAQRYAVLYADPGVLTHADLAAQLVHLRTGFQVTSVGISARQARWVAARVRDALAGWSPHSTGLRATPVQHLSSSPVRRDDDVAPPLFYVADQYETHAVRL